MPQMAPLNWLILFLIFSLTFIFFNILNYFCFHNLMKNKKMMMKSNNNFYFFNWKW